MVRSGLDSHACVQIDAPRERSLPTCQLPAARLQGGLHGGWRMHERAKRVAFQSAAQIADRKYQAHVGARAATSGLAARGPADPFEQQSSPLVQSVLPVSGKIRFSDFLVEVANGRSAAGGTHDVRRA